MSGNQWVFLVVFLGFLLAMVIVGIVVSRFVKTGEDFLMGGRGLTTPLLVGTTLATLVGTGSSMGAVGFSYESGWAGTLYGIGGSVGMILLLYLFADVRKHNFMTFSEELARSEEHTSELQSRGHLVCRLLLEKKKQKQTWLLDQSLKENLFFKLRY